MTQTRAIPMKHKKKNSTLLADTYYNPSDPAAFAGVSKLKKKFPNVDVTSWLASQPTYTLHKPMLRRFPTRKYRSSGPNHLWQMDLMEMIPYASVNKGYRYILTCVDVFTRFARAEPIKAKDGGKVAVAIEMMLKNAGKDKKPIHIQTDLGMEFYNKIVQEVFKKHKIRHYSVHSQYKAAVVERFNRTLREKLNRYFTHHGKKTWLSVLPDIINAYNNTSHRGIGGKKPVDVTNDLNFWLSQENITSKRAANRIYAVNTLVRISRLSNNPFRKNFDQNWSEEIFKIHAIDKRDNPVMYILQDLKGEIIQGKFYRQELQVVDKNLPKVYRIEKIIRTRNKGKHKQYLVKWYGYDDSHNSWISDSAFVD